MRLTVLYDDNDGLSRISETVNRKVEKFRINTFEYRSIGWHIYAPKSKANPYSKILML